MKKINQIVMLIALFALQSNIKAQVVLKDITTPNKGSSANSSLTDNDLDRSVKTSPTSTLSVLSSVSTNEAVPSPEQQGFNKLIINGKTVYMKKVDDIIIEYRPE